MRIRSCFSVLVALIVLATAAPVSAQSDDVCGVGGVIVVGLDQQPFTLNPFAPGGFSLATTEIGQAYLVGATEIDGETLERVPELLVELPTVANGGITVNDDGTMTVQYQIRPEAVWADGTPISGTDFLFTYETIMDPDSCIEVEDYYYPDEMIEECPDRFVYEDIIPESVVAGDKTFEFALPEPTFMHEFLFATVLPAHDIEGTSLLEDWNDTMWVSGGPFEFEEWVEEESIRVVRNENYWGTDAETGQHLPCLDEVVFRLTWEPDELIGWLLDGDVDVTSVFADPELVTELRDAGLQVDVIPGPVWEQINFQFGPGRLERNADSLNEHRLFRRAVAHAIDRDRLASELTDDLAVSMDSYVDTHMPSLSQAAWSQYDFNPATASTMLAELCGDLGRDCDNNPPTLTFTTALNFELRVEMSALLDEMLTDVGIVYVEELEDSQDFFGETIENGTYDLGEWAWVGETGMSGLVAGHDRWSPDAVDCSGDEPQIEGMNFGRWGTCDSVTQDEASERFLELLEAMNTSVDEGEVATLVAEAEGILADEVVIIPLFQRPMAFALNADRLAGFVPNPTSAGFTAGMAMWRQLDIGGGDDGDDGDFAPDAGLDEAEPTTPVDDSDDDGCCSVSGRRPIGNGAIVALLLGIGVVWSRRRAGRQNRLRRNS